MAMNAVLLIDTIAPTVLPALEPPSLKRQHDLELLKQPPVKLSSPQRAIVEFAIRETCKIRRWNLLTVKVRTNHVHAVIAASKPPDGVLNVLKANATRSMREAGLWTSELSPWEFRGSKKYLWDDEQLSKAIAYVESGQGEPLD